MDIAIIIIIVAAVCGLGFLSGIFRGSDKRADALEHRNPDVAKALRDRQRNMDRGNDFFNP
ncbi:hypothetical protein [Arthrobacter humicola]|jgi:hypothetical protein